MPPKKCTGAASTPAEAVKDKCITPNMEAKLNPAMLAGLVAYRKRQAEAKASGTPLVRKKKVKKAMADALPDGVEPLPGVKQKRKYNRKALGPQVGMPVIVA
jgi:hypothetical protein